MANKDFNKKYNSISLNRLFRVIVSFAVVLSIIFSLITDRFLANTNQYNVKDHEGDEDVITPRVEFHFLDENTNGEVISMGSDAVYHVTPFEFINKGASPNNTQETQILSDGESLELIANPANTVNHYFYGWYIVNGYNYSGVTDNNGLKKDSNGNVEEIYYTWPEQPGTLTFEENIQITTSENKVGGTLSWTMGNSSGTAIMDEEGIAHVIVAPVYKDYHFVNFMQKSKEVVSSGVDSLMTRKLFVFGSAPSVSVKISDVRSPSTDAIRLVFNGWEYSTDGGNTYTQIQTVDFTGNEIKDPGKDGVYLNVTGDVDLFPIFIEARWIDFNRGKSGNGATYIKSRFLKAWKDGFSMDENEQETILTKLDVPVLNGYTFDGWVLDPTTFDENGFPTDGIRITDGTGTVLSNSELAAVNGSSYSSGYTGYCNGEKAYTVIDGKIKVWNGLDKRLTLYAKWSENVNTDYTVIVWKQKASDEVGLDFADKKYSYEESAVITNQPSGQTVSEVKNSGAIDAYLQKNYTGFNSMPTVTMSTDRLSGDGSTIVNVYYDRNTYNLYFTNSRGNRDSSKTITALYGHDITNVWPYNGSESRVWIESDGIYRGILFEMPSHDWEYRYYSSSGNYKYTSDYYIQNIDDDDYSLEFDGYDSYKNSNDNAYSFSVKNASGEFLDAPLIPGFTAIRVEGVKGKQNLSKPNYQWVAADEYKNPGIANIAGDTDAIYGYHKAIDDIRYNLYYNRNKYYIDFYSNYPTHSSVTWEDIGGESNKSPNIYKINDIKYKKSLAEYAANGTNGYTPMAPDHYEFTGWYEDATCKVPFDFSTEVMPNHNLKLYAGWEPVKYRIDIDPNGAEIDHINHNTDTNGYAAYGIPTFRGSSGGSYVSSQATYFNALYNEPIGEYQLTRNYVPLSDTEISTYTGTKYWYINTQYYSDHGEGIASDARNAIYVTESELTEYYEFYKAVKNANSTYIPTWTENVTDYATWYSRYVTGPYRKCDAGDTYTFIGWYQEYDDGSLASSPYNFNDPVSGNMKLKAIWRLEGGIYIDYNPESIIVDGDDVTAINGNLSQWTDPLDISLKLYSDQAPTNIVQQPTNIHVTVNGVVSDEQYIFRGWHVVRKNGTITVGGEEIQLWEPVQSPDKFYDPSQAFTIDSTLVSDTTSVGKVIYMQAYYEKVDNSYRRPSVVTNLTLDANTSYMGSIISGKTTDDLPTWNSTGYQEISGNQILFNGIQSNKSIHVYKYATDLTEDDYGNSLSPEGQQYFEHSAGYQLIGFDSNQDPMNLSTGSPFVPAVAADGIISIGRNSSDLLYAVWEPRVYVTFVNTTDKDIVLDLSGSSSNTLQVRNEMTGKYGRRQLTSTEITIPKKNGSKNGELKIVFPVATPGTDTVKITGTNNHSGYLLNARSEFNGVENDSFSDVKYGNPFSLTDTLMTDATGVVMTFEETELSELYYDVNGGSWNDTSSDYTYSSSDDYYVYGNYLRTAPTPQPDDPTAPSGKVFCGWTTTKDDYSTLYDFSSAAPAGTTFYAYYWTGEQTTVPVRYLIQNTDGTYKEITGNTSYLNNRAPTSISISSDGDSLPDKLKYDNNNNVCRYLTSTYRNQYDIVSYSLGSNDTTKVDSNQSSDYFDIRYIKSNQTTRDNPYLKNTINGIMWSDDDSTWSGYDGNPAVYVIFSEYTTSHVIVNTIIQGNAADFTKTISYTGAVAASDNRFKSYTDSFTQENGDSHVIDLFYYRRNAWSTPSTTTLTLNPSNPTEYDAYTVTMYVNGETRSSTQYIYTSTQTATDITVTYVYEKNVPETDSIEFTVGDVIRNYNGSENIVNYNTDDTNEVAVEITDIVYRGLDFSGMTSDTATVDGKEVTYYEYIYEYTNQSGDVYYSHSIPIRFYVLNVSGSGTDVGNYSIDLKNKGSGNLTILSGYNAPTSVEVSDIYIHIGDDTVNQVDYKSYLNKAMHTAFDASNYDYSEVSYTPGTLTINPGYVFFELNVQSYGPEFTDGNYHTITDDIKFYQAVDDGHGGYTKGSEITTLVEGTDYQIDYDFGSGTYEADKSQYKDVITVENIKVRFTNLTDNCVFIDTDNNTYTKNGEYVQTKDIMNNNIYVKILAEPTPTRVWIRNSFKFIIFLIGCIGISEIYIIKKKKHNRKGD